MVRHHPFALPVPMLTVDETTRSWLLSCPNVNMTWGYWITENEMDPLLSQTAWAMSWINIRRKGLFIPKLWNSLLQITLGPVTTDSAEQICCFQITTDCHQRELFPLVLYKRTALLLYGSQQWAVTISCPPDTQEVGCFHAVSHHYFSLSVRSCSPRLMCFAHELLCSCGEEGVLCSVGARVWWQLVWKKI